MSGATVLGHRAASARSPPGPSRDGSPTACRSRVAPKSTASRTRRSNSAPVVLVGVGRALALAEAAERAADHADVRDVDVAVDDERDRLPRQLGPQLVGRRRASPRSPRGAVSANSAVSSSAVSQRPSRPLSIAAPDQLGANRAVLAPARPAAGDERPVARLDHVEHALGHPLGVDVLRVHAQALGQREALAGQPLAHLVGRGERVLGRDVIAVGRQPAEVGGAGAHQLGPPVRQVGRDLDADAGHQPRALGHQALHVGDRHLAGPVRQRQVGSAAHAGAPVLVGGLGRRSAPARGRSRTGGGRSSAGSPPAGARGARARRSAPPARPSVRPPSRRSRPGSRW